MNDVTHDALSGNSHSEQGSLLKMQQMCLQRCNIL